MDNIQWITNIQVALLEEKKFQQSRKSKQAVKLQKSGLLCFAEISILLIACNTRCVLNWKWYLFLQAVLLKPAALARVPVHV